MPRMTNDEKIVQTEVGWAIESETPPWRRDMFWCKTPERHVYTFQEDGWYRVVPPDRGFLPEGDLNHG